MRFETESGILTVDDSGMTLETDGSKRFIRRFPEMPDVNEDNAEEMAKAFLTTWKRCE
ncbi:MAG: hypothetical protein MJ117_00420 [Lachnospiraceae bacterium]|nr:hypothetical protein [Lachnospiraceae bacterium]